MEKFGQPLSSEVLTLFPELKGLAVLDTFTERANLPKKAPALWEKDRLPHETPPAFAKRVYAPWLGKGLSMADVYRLDRKLYSNLANWATLHNGLPADLDLPTREERNTRWIERVEKAGLLTLPADGRFKSLRGLLVAAARREAEEMQR